MAVQVTDIARDKLKEIISDSGLSNPAVRIVFEGFG